MNARLAISLLIGLSACLASACSGAVRRDAHTIEARLIGDSTLQLSIGASNAEDNRADVVLSETEVVVTVTTDDPVGGDDCADGLRVGLTEPLGDRVVVDGSTGEQVTFIFRN